jgi:predicted Zn-dependent protease
LSTTVAAACLSALITLWLGWIAHFSAGGSAETVAVPDQLAVVHVQAGETLQQLAGRMVPGAPVAQVVERIRDLNNLDSAAIGAGQTLIAPVG